MTRFVFTINNPLVDEGEGVYLPVRNNPVSFFENGYFKFLCFQGEVGGTEETPHYQGYFELTKRERVTAVRRKLAWGYVEIAKKDKATCVHYASKPVPGCGCTKFCNPPEGIPKRMDDWEGPVLCGEVSAKQGSKKNVTVGLIKRIKGGEDPYDIILGLTDEKEASHCFNRMPSSTKLAAEVRRRKVGVRKWQTDAVFLVGIQGCGKSWFTLAKWPNAFYLSRPIGSQRLWWDGYTDQEVVIIEEAASWLELAMIKDLICVRPFSVQPRYGGTVPFVSKRIVFVSNNEPEAWWPGEDLVGERRFDE